MKDYDSAFPGSPGFSQDGMTLTQYAAIHLKVPMSGDSEIDKMIRESRRMDFAGQAITGALHESQFPMRTAKDAVRLANGVLVEWGDHCREVRLDEQKSNQKRNKENRSSF